MHVVCSNRPKVWLDLLRKANTEIVVYNLVKADLHGTILAYDCRMRFLLRALLASLKNRIRFPRYQIA